MAFDIALEALPVGRRHRLDVDRDRNMADGAMRQGIAAGEIDDVLDMLRRHEPLVVGGHILKEVILVDVLQVMRADQVVIGHPGDRQHRGAVDLRIVKPVEQVHRAGGRGRENDTEPAGEFGVAASSQCRRFLVPAVDKADAVLGSAQGFDKAVDAVAGQSENGVDPPLGKDRDDVVANRLRHNYLHALWRRTHIFDAIAKVIVPNRRKTFLPPMALNRQVRESISRCRPDNGVNRAARKPRPALRYTRTGHPNLKMLKPKSPSSWPRRGVA